MTDHFLTIDLTETVWQSDWNGDEIGFPEVEGAIGLYTQHRDDGVYNFYIDYENSRVLDFWKDDEDDREEMILDYL